MDDYYNESLDPNRQISAEELIAAYLFDNFREGFSEIDAGNAGRKILKATLREFRPDLFEDYDHHSSPPAKFADPGGRSALRAAGPNNPRSLPCPTCGRENMLTPKDKRLGYQCDICADQAEGLRPNAYY